MDRNGFIEGKVRCKSCGKELSGEDGAGLATLVVVGETIPMNQESDGGPTWFS